jgi:RNA polymerase sigma-70 factor (ECF subfamily)
MTVATPTAPSIARRAVTPEPADRLVAVVDTDAALVRRTLDGDLSAFELIVDRHRDVVTRVAARIVGPDEAEDVAQDALLRAFHRLHQYRGDAPFRAWLLRIVHNTALNTLNRRRVEMSPEPLEDLAARGDPATRTQLTPASELVGAERTRRLRTKIDALRGPHREVLVLRDLAGLSYEEIAEVTDMPIGSVKGRLHRARNELIELLRNNTYDWELPA